MKIWVDDVRPCPEGYYWIKSVNDFISIINLYKDDIEIIDLDHDAGDFYCDGGDYIKILDYLEYQGLSYCFHIHSMNPVGVQNMKNIINRNKWKLI